MTIPLRRLLVLALLPLAVAACRPRATGMSSLPASGELDTFEDGNTESAAGATWKAIHEGTEGVTASLGVQPDGFRSKAYHLVVTGFVPPEAGQRALMGARAALASDADGSEQSVDVSAFSKVGLALKGTPGTYVVQLGVNQPDGSILPYNAYVAGTPNWTEFLLSLADFKYDSGTTPQAWSGGAVRYVAVYAAGTGDITFELDDLRFVP